ncbi:unnamed protein product [Ambrosiozyma monospora]|uniref:Metacaspase-1 n=1 Tax=Ambrosiozyma monospora TaxID=43982 RepID=A0A9W7DDU5_AMBMO|nr:unnamed protein product [Ambrosiozyma monospora]
MYPGGGQYNYQGYQQGGYNAPPSQSSYGGYQPPPGPPTDQYGYNQGGYEQQPQYGGYQQQQRGYGEPQQQQYNYNQGGYGQGGYNNPPPAENYGYGGYPGGGEQSYQRPSGPPPAVTYNQSNFYNSETTSYANEYRGVTYQRPTGELRPPETSGGYSSCRGNKKALLIGVNYIGSKNALRGCINDVHNMYNFLTRHGYSADNIVMLTDDNKESVKVPLRDNILRGMGWLVKNAQPGDSLFFHYSGHGGQEEDKEGDEVDGMDNCIYPVDFEQKGSIIDDIINEKLVQPLPEGVRLTAIFDSCHSGSVMDLPFTYRAQDGGLKEYNVWKESKEDAINMVKGYAAKNTQLMVSSAMNVFNRIKTSSAVNQDELKEEKSSRADVMMFSGCKDDQTSADANEAGKFTGALSWALLQVLNDEPNQTYLTLLQNIRSVLATKYTQKPQLSTSHKIDPNVQFVL